MTILHETPTFLEVISMDPNLEIASNPSSFQYQKPLEFFLDDIDDIKIEICGKTKKKKARTNDIASNSHFFLGGGGEGANSMEPSWTWKWIWHQSVSFHHQKVLEILF